MKATFILLIMLSMLPKPNPLAKYQWENRLLLVFAPTPDNEFYQTQLQMIESMGDGWAERELVLFSVFPNTASDSKGDLSTAEIQYLRDRFQIADGDFVVLLIGKDGGEKLRLTQENLTESQLFPLIDGMPMRKAEMRARQN